MPARARQPGKVIPLRRPMATRVRVTVRGPADPVAAEALRRAIVMDLTKLAVNNLLDGKLPPAPALTPRARRR